jgi:hypothetical protein
MAVDAVGDGVTGERTGTATPLSIIGIFTWETATGVAAITAAGIIVRPAINRDTRAIVRQPIRGTGVLRQQLCRLRTQAIAPAMEMVAAIVQVGLATEMVTGIARETAARRRCPQIQ